MNFLYYSKAFIYNTLPYYFFHKKYRKIRYYEYRNYSNQLEERLNYYIKYNASFESKLLKTNSIENKRFKKTSSKTGYYLDLKEYLHYFSDHAFFSFHFGDQLHINPYPTLFKARPLITNNSNSILFKLNKYRHFRWVKDPYKFEEKKDKLIWRGSAYSYLRKNFVKNYWNHPLCDVGQFNKPFENVPWQLKNKTSIKEQLLFKFICCPEGKDVATNLKWVMSSNSLAVMPKPTCETWFMEGTLQAGQHYAEVKNDFSNLEQVIDYYLTYPNKAKEIIKEANKHTQQFRNPYLEDLLCFKVLECYFERSGQTNYLRFR